MAPNSVTVGMRMPLHAGHLLTVITAASPSRLPMWGWPGFALTHLSFSPLGSHPGIRSNSMMRTRGSSAVLLGFPLVRPAAFAHPAFILLTISPSCTPRAAGIAATELRPVLPPGPSLQLHIARDRSSSCSPSP